MKYHYCGPITRFGKIVIRKFDAITEAASEAKALSNICYRAKTSIGYEPSWRVEANKKFLVQLKTETDDREIQLEMKF